MPAVYGNAYAQFIRFVATGATLFEGVSRSGYGRVLYVHRLSMFNLNQVSATGALIAVGLYRTTGSGVGGASVTRVFEVLPEMDDPGDEVPTGVEFWTGRSVVTSALLRRVSYAADDVNLVSSHNTTPYLTMEVPYAVLWETCRSTIVQPLTLRAGEGFALAQTEALAVGWCDYEALFSAE